jgi:integrase
LLDVTSTLPVMASLVRKKGSKFWFAAYRDLGGKQHRQTTGETDRKKAILIAQDYEGIAQGKVKRHRALERIAELYRQVYGEEVPTASVRHFVEEWLSLKTPEVSCSTLASYKKSAAKFLKYLGTAADSDIAIIRRATIAGFRNDLVKTVSPKTTNFDLKLVQAVFRSAKKEGYLLEDPAEFVEPVKRENSRTARRAFTIDELRAVLANADDEWKSLIKFGLYTGQRLGDIAALTWSNVDLERNVIRLTTRKTGKALTIPIADLLRTHILALTTVSDNPREPLHARAFRVISSKGRNKKIGGPQHVLVNQLSNEFVDLLASVGLRKPVSYKTNGKGCGGRRVASELSFHSLRHTAVTLLKDAGIPQAVVQELIGHDSEQMNALYTHVGQEALERATAAFPEL